MNELDRYAVSLENMELLRAQVEELEAWKAEELALMNPLMDYARSVCTGPLGCSITEWLIEDHKAQAREIERLSDRNCAVEDELARNLDYKVMCVEQRKELAALKAKPSGVVDAQRLLDWNRSQPEPRPIVVGREYQVADACARLNQPASAGDDQARASLSVNHSEQVRHMVMEGVTVERDVFGTIHIKSGDFDFIQIRYQYPYTDNSGTWKLAERIVALLAAAPSAGSQEKG